MKKNINNLLLAFMPCIFYSCQGMSGLFSSVEQIADDTAIKTEISKEALQRDTDLEITVKVLNKDVKNAAP
jgi:hypothetical protein